MTEIISKDQLLGSASLAERVIELDGIGAVRIRSLSRAEVLKIERFPEPEAKDRHIIGCGLLEPALSPAEIQRWQQSAPVNVVGQLTDAIGALSGLRDDAAKEATKSAGD